MLTACYMTSCVYEYGLYQCQLFLIVILTYALCANMSCLHIMHYTYLSGNSFRQAVALKKRVGYATQTEQVI